MMFRASHGKGLLFFGLYIAEKRRDYPNPDPVFSVTEELKRNRPSAACFQENRGRKDKLNTKTDF